jgi:hypothetical protein
VHLAGAGFPQHADDLARRVPAHDRVVDHDQPFSVDRRLQRIELQPDAELTDRLCRLDERAADVAVLDDAFAVGDAARFGEPGGRDRPGVGDPDDQIGVGGGFLGEETAELTPHLVHVAVVHVRVRPREVHVFEDAKLRIGLREHAAAKAISVDGDDLARLHVPHEGCSDDVERAGLGSDDPAAVRHAPDHERPDAVRIANAVDGLLVHDHERIGALQERYRLRDRVLKPLAASVGEHLRDDVGVGGRLRAVAALDHRSELAGVGQVSVMAERHPAFGGRLERRLRVLPAVAARRRVAGVTDAEVAAERRERRLAEDLGDQAHVLIDEDPGAVRDRDTGGFLAAVLEAVEPEEDELGYLFTRRPNAEQTTCFFRRFGPHVTVSLSAGRTVPLGPRSRLSTRLF